MAQTILQISETNIFPNIVDHAGLMHQHLHCLIESRLQETPPGQTSTSLHKSSFPALKMMDAMEEKLSMPSNGCPKMISLMKLAQSTEQEVTTMDKNAQQWLYAKTVCQTSHASSQIPIILTELKNTDKSPEKRPWCKKFTKEDLLLVVLLYQML